MLNEQVISNIQAKQESMAIGSGICLAVLSSIIPFMFAFQVARLSGLNAHNYPAVEHIAAAAGLLTCLLSIPVVLDMKKGRSAQSIAMTGGVLFWMLGMLTAFTM